MNRERNISRAFLISGVIASVLVITLIGVLIAKAQNRARENSFAEDLSKIESNLLDSESASSAIGKSIEENEDLDDDVDDEDIENEAKEASTNTINTSDNNINTVEITENKIVEEKKEIETNSKVEKKEEKKENKIDFQVPIKGKILREFAKDSLVFSNTLQEWITHNGVDIKADKTSVVKSAAAGTVAAIKNDPRYGLTVIINHDNDYQTIYSNLLTAEFVVKGEKVEKGQTIGTIGNSASFEVSDEYHLHFEMLKNNEYIDPTLYMNFE